MKEIKLKTLWAVDIDTIQFRCFKYKKEAKEYAKKTGKKVAAKSMKKGAKRGY